MSTVGPWRPGSSIESTGGRRRPIFRRHRGAPDDVTLEGPIVRSRLLSRVHVAEGVVILMVMLLLFGFWRLTPLRRSFFCTSGASCRLGCPSQRQRMFPRLVVDMSYTNT